MPQTVCDIHLPPQLSEPLSITVDRWPYMMTDKTWDALQDVLTQERSQLREHRVISSVLRNCKLQKMQLDAHAGFPLHDHTSGTAAFMHSKVCMRSWDSGCGWVYMGSHNFSPAAWGKPLPSDKVAGAGGLQHLWIANYELGVLRIGEPGGELDKPFWKGLGRQLGFKPGSLYSTSAHEPATQRKIGKLARQLKADPPSSSHLVGAPPGALLPGVPLREVVVGVVPSCEWLPGQQRLDDGEDDDELAYQRWQHRMESERANADREAGRYAMALVGS